MNVQAIGLIGTLHALPAVACFHSGLSVFALPETNSLSRARIRYVGVRMMLASLALTLCVISSWQQPALAWAFALASLAMYLPTPARFSAAGNPSISPATRNIIRYVPAAFVARAIGVLALVLATFWLRA